MKLEPHVKRIAIAVVLGAIMSVLSTTIVNVALADARGRARRAAGQRPVGRDRLHARPRRRHPRLRLGRRPLRRPPPLRHLPRPLHRGLRALRLRLEPRVARRRARAPGPRGRPAGPDRPDRLVKAAGPRNMARVMSVDRRPDHPRPRLRPHARRPARRARRLAVRSSSSTSRSASSPRSPRCGCCRTTTAPEAAEKLDATGLALVATGLVGITYGLAEIGTAGIADRARGARPRARPASRSSPPSSSARCASRTRCWTSACTPTRRSRPRRSRRSASAPRCSAAWS